MCLRKGRGKPGKPDGMFWRVGGNPGSGSLPLQPQSGRARSRGEEPTVVFFLERWSVRELEQVRSDTWGWHGRGGAPGKMGDGSEGS